MARDLPLRTYDLSRDRKERGQQASALRLLGDIGWQRDPPYVDRAIAHSRWALALGEALSMHPLQAHCNLGLDTLYVLTGRRGQAYAELSAAIDLYRAMEMTFWLPQAEATWRRWNKLPLKLRRIR